MKITAIETFTVCIPLKSEFRMKSALGAHTISNYVLVRLQTDTPHEGVGEATVMPRWSGETVWGTQALIDRILAPALIGHDPRDIEGAMQLMHSLAADNWFAKSALEMACWDAWGRSEGKPVYELLGGACRDVRIRGRFSLGAYDVPRASARARELVEMGFDTIKVKVGGRAEDDIARVRAVREAIGAERALVIDANCGWDADTAIHCINELSDARLALVEQPTPKGDFGALARVRRETQPPVMADDICFDLVDAQELIRNESCDVISVYPGKNGGILASKKIVELAAQHDVACSIGSNLELDVATAAMGHLIVACPNLQVEKYPGDIYGPIYHEARIARNPLAIGGSYTQLNEGPGLGVDVDWDFVKAHPSS